MAVRVHGLEPGRTDTGFALMVLRLATPTDRAGLVELIRRLAALVLDAEHFLAELPPDCDVAIQIIGVPWAPPRDAAALDAQRRQIEAADAPGIEQAWFFQIGTRLSGAREPVPVGLRFPVDGYPAILDAFDWEDFGIAVKLSGPWRAGESTVLAGFHAMWLAPYAGRYRNAAVTVDPRHHAAHFWIDRCAGPWSPREQVHHLLWVVGKLDEVAPVLHARFRGATMAQKADRLSGGSRASFVLGGNPLIAAHRAGGESAVDAWIASQTSWAGAEVAHMLRELAEDMVATDRTAPSPPDSDDDEDDEDEDDDGADDEPAVSERAVTDPHARRGDDELRERTRDLTSHAGELLAARARAGALDPRAAARLRPLLELADKYEHRRIAAVAILGALRDRASAPAMIGILDATRIVSALDGVGKAELLTATAAALGAIGDPAAIPALSRLVASPGRYNDEPRVAAASALAACVAAAPERRSRADQDDGRERDALELPALDEGVFGALARSIEQCEDDEHAAELHLAYGALARTLPAAQVPAARQRLLEVDIELDADGVAMLARRAALIACAGGARPDDASLLALRARIGAALADPGYDHETAIRNIRIVLGILARLPELVDASDLVWLTRLTEPDIRARAHELLEAAGHPMPPAAAFDRRAARALPDAELAQWIGEPHVVGRAALVIEAGRRRLSGARPAILAAAHAAIDRARPAGQGLLAPDARLLETAVAALVDGPLDNATISLFDRMLRHHNQHVKWELLQAPPRDERLIGGMLHVVGEGWGWQEAAARKWLASYTTDTDDGDDGDDGDDDGRMN